MAYETGFGGKHLEKPVFDYIYQHVPHGSSILELGSGWVTGQLAQYYTMHSIEENEQWLYLYDSHYIHAPLRDGWYDVDVLRRELPTVSYRCVIVDGPFRKRHRAGLVKHIDLFDWSAIFIHDEVQFSGMYDIMKQTANIMGHQYAVYTGESEQFGVTWPQT